VDGFLSGGLVDAGGVVDVTQSRYEDKLNMVSELGVLWAFVAVEDACGAVVVMLATGDGLQEQFCRPSMSVGCGSIRYLGLTILGMWFIVGVNAGIAVESGKISTSDFEADAEMLMDRGSRSAESRNIIMQVVYEV
jgi:hypothetical protein